MRCKLKIGSVVIERIDFEKMLTFWQEALHYVPREPAENGWVVLRDPAGRNVNVSLNQVSERLMGRNWLHFDLYTNDQEGEVERLLKIGARCHPQVYEPDDDRIGEGRISGNPMKTAKVSVTRRGQTTVPAEFRKKYGIEEGSALQIEDTGRGLLVKRARSTSDLIGTGKRPQREVFEALDKMREEDDR